MSTTISTGSTIGSIRLAAESFSYSCALKLWAAMLATNPKTIEVDQFANGTGYFDTAIEYRYEETADGKDFSPRMGTDIHGRKVLIVPSPGNPTIVIFERYVRKDVEKDLLHLIVHHKGSVYNINDKTMVLALVTAASQAFPA